jgi:hypothetical protein
VQTSGVSNGKIYSNWSALQTLTVAGDARPAKKRAQPPAS